MSSLIIAGAGLTGLIAAHAFPRAAVREKASLEDCARQEHAALLRFRTDAVSRITGIPFRKVSVQKSVVLDGAHVRLDLALANRYAAKVLSATGGGISGRSIWNLDTVTRYVAPHDFISVMRANLAERIEYDAEVAFDTAAGPVISTAPLPVTLRAISGYDPLLRYAPIHVQRFRLVGVDLFQTIYYPGKETDVYRASVTGDMLIVESLVTALDRPQNHELLRDILVDFGLDVQAEALDSKVQKYGKIVEIDSLQRRRIMRIMTEDFNLYSLGRFATWRNILLDDVANDIEVIRRLMSVDSYGRELH